MGARAEEYRRLAEEAEEKARLARDQAARDIYEDIAKRWREMAASADRQDW